MLLQLYTLSELMKMTKEVSDKSKGNIKKRKRIKTPREIVGEFRYVRGWHHPVQYPRPLRGFR